MTEGFIIVSQYAVVLKPIIPIDEAILKIVQPNSQINSGLLTARRFWVLRTLAIGSTGFMEAGQLKQFFTKLDCSHPYILQASDPRSGKYYFLMNGGADR
ncbi:MAG TPA: hypothetical protein V6C65_32930 [Allocoleopsis sp.]